MRDCTNCRPSRETDDQAVRFWRDPDFLTVPRLVERAPLLRERDAAPRALPRDRSLVRPVELRPLVERAAVRRLRDCGDVR